MVLNKKNCLCVFLNVQIIFFQIVEFFRSQLVLCRLVTLVILINAFSALFFLPFFSLHITKLMFIHITSDFLSIHLMISCFPFIRGAIHKWRSLIFLNFFGLYLYKLWIFYTKYYFLCQELHSLTSVVRRGIKAFLP